MFKSNVLIGAGFVNRYHSPGRLAVNERNSFSVSPDLHEILIGLILGPEGPCPERCRAPFGARRLIHAQAHILMLYSILNKV